MALPSPEPARGWLGLVWPVLQQASGVTLLVMLVMLGLTYLELKRVHRHNEGLVRDLVTTKDEQLAWLRQYVHCTPPAAGEGR